MVEAPRCWCRGGGGRERKVGWLREEGALMKGGGSENAWGSTEGRV